MNTRIITTALIMMACSLSFGVKGEIIEISSTYDEDSGKWVGDVVAFTNALNNLKANDVISLAKGEYDVSFMTNAPMRINYDNGYGISMLYVNKKNCEIRGATGNREDVVIVAKDVMYRVLELNGESAALRDLTVKGGDAGEACARYNYRNGGGVLMADINAVISNCVFESCNAARGGGAVSAPYNAKRGYVYDSLFRGNNSGGPGGGAAWNCRLISGCTVVSNTASYGGGIAECSSVTNCFIAYNYSRNRGGGLYECPKAIDCEIVGNVADDNSSGGYGGSYKGCSFRDNYHRSVGNGISMERCDVADGGVNCLTNINCVFHHLHNSKNDVWSKGNVSHPEGVSGKKPYYGFESFDLMRGCLITNCNWRSGGDATVNASLISNRRTDVRIENCTIADNTYYYLGRDFDEGVAIVNCAIVRNKRSDGTAGDITLHDSAKFCFSNCVWNVRGSWTYTTQDESYVDGENYVLGEAGNLKFLGNGEHPYTPRLTSVLREAGKVLDWMEDSVDIAGNPRLRDGKVDIGAYQCWIMPMGFVITVY